MKTFQMRDYLKFRGAEAVITRDHKTIRCSFGQPVS